jgi:sugar phosphate isomerase/epimerase
MNMSNVLLATCWISAGDSVPVPGRDYSPIALPTRIKAAADAGFGGFGILHTDLERYLETGSVAQLKTILNDNGMRYVEVEFLNHWWADGEPRKESDLLRAKLMEVAAELSAHHIKVAPDLDSMELEMNRMAEEFHNLCADAARHGTAIAIEFMPFSNIYNIEVATELVVKADHPAGGLMVDLWHLERAGSKIDSLLKVPFDKIIGVELDDGAAIQVGDGYSDTINNRKLCGTGDFAVVEWISTLHKMGWRGPWGVEIISNELRSLDINSALTQVFETTIGQFELAGLEKPIR